jgi:hypothetical protein
MGGRAVLSPFFSSNGLAVSSQNYALAMNAQRKQLIFVDRLVMPVAAVLHNVGAKLFQLFRFAFVANFSERNASRVVNPKRFKS